MKKAKKKKKRKIRLISDLRKVAKENEEYGKGETNPYGEKSEDY